MSTESGTRSASLRNYAVVLFVWTLLIALSFFFNKARNDDQAVNMAQAAARANIQKDLSFRKWATSHGGVFVPETEHTPPNPYLSITNQEATTTSGTHLILMNPAYMLSQMQSDFGNDFGLRSRITSLKPLNPLNAPDAWESESLRAFERGAKVAQTVEQIDGEPFLRMLLPFIAEEGCMKCHGHQGYKVGDVRGAIGSAVAMTPFVELQADGRRQLALSHLFIWMIGLIGISTYFLRNYGLEQQRNGVQQALLESNKRLHLGLGIARQAWFEINLLNGQMTTSTEYEDLLGEGGAAVPTDLAAWLSDIHPEDRSVLQARLAIAQDTGAPEEVEYRQRNKLGAWQWMASVFQVVARGPEGKATHLTGIHMDMDAQKLRELALANREKQLRFVLAGSKLGFWDWNIAEGTVERNEEWANMLGYTHAEIVQTPRQWTDFIHPDDRSRAWDSINAVLEGRANQHKLEYRMLHKDGSVRWILDQAGVMQRDADGKPLRMCGTHTDITQHKQAEAILKESEARYRYLVESLPDVAYTYSMERGGIYYSPHVADLLGYSVDHLLAHPFLWAESIHPDDQPRVSQAISLALSTQIPFKLEYRIRDVHGAWRWVFDRAIAFRQVGSDMLIEGLAMDVSENKAIQHELAQYRQDLECLVEERTSELTIAKNEAEAANVAKSAFLANMSHEIRTPLNAISGMVNILRRNGANPQQTDKLDKIETASQHLLEIINAILDLSKIEAGKFALDEAPIKIEEIVEAVASMMGEKARAKGLALHLDLQAVPRGLLGDRTRLTQVLLNYTTNAVKFTETGSITLRLRVLEDTPEFALFRIEVEDTGIGIAADAIPRLFTAFEQIDQTVTRKYGGTGLGLAITHHIAELMGGETGVISEPGKGSTFWLTVRLRKHTRQSDEQAGDTLEFAEAMIRVRHGGTRILLVEDEPINCEVAEAILGDAGLLVDVAEDGLKAVARAQAEHYALILMDVQMPNLDGLEATRRIRQSVGLANVPIIAMTANAFVEDKARCLAAGMNDFVPKPVDPERLLSTLLRWLEKPRQVEP